MSGYPRLEAGITFSQSTELDYSAARIHALQRSIALAQRSDASTTLSCRSSCIALAFFAIESASVQIANHASALTTSTLALLARCKNSASPALREPRRKDHALYYEFEEVGINKKYGYTSAADLIDLYPQFYFNSLSSHLETAIR